MDAVDDSDIIFEKITIPEGARPVSSFLVIITSKWMCTGYYGCR